MISRIDIEDWDRESHQAYLEWAEDYGIDYEPWIGHPDIYAAWQAAVIWVRSQGDAQEPTAYMSPSKDEFCTVEDAGTYIPKTWFALYTAPQQRPWVELTAQEIHDTEGYKETREMYRFAHAIEAKLKEKNT